MAIVVVCPPNQVQHAWSQCVPHLERAVKFSEGRHTIESVKSLVETGKAQLWLIIEGKKVIACVVTEIRDYPMKRCISILLCGGDYMKTWLSAFVEKLKSTGIQMNVDSIEVIGRPGWVRALYEYDFFEKPVYFLECELK